MFIDISRYLFSAIVSCYTIHKVKKFPALKLTDNEMLFAILILMILVTSASVWYSQGRIACTALFMLTAVCIATVLILDIDTPLHLAF